MFLQHSEYCCQWFTQVYWNEPFPSLWPKLKKKKEQKTFKTVSWAYFHHVLLGKWLTCMSLSRTAMVPCTFLFAAILNAILEQHLSQEESINRSSTSTLAFLFFGTQGWEVALLLNFPGYILFVLVDYLLADFHLFSVHPSFLLCFWRKLILWDQTLCLSFSPSKF